jgi:hypothetical protein
MPPPVQLAKLPRKPLPTVGQVLLLSDEILVRGQSMLDQDNRIDAKHDFVAGSIHQPLHDVV